MFCSGTLFCLLGFLFPIKGGTVSAADGQSSMNQHPLAKLKRTKVLFIYKYKQKISSNLNLLLKINSLFSVFSLSMEKFSTSIIFRGMNHNRIEFTQYTASKQICVENRVSNVVQAKSDLMFHPRLFSLPKFVLQSSMKVQRCS